MPSTPSSASITHSLPFDVAAPTSSPPYRFTSSSREFPWALAHLTQEEVAREQRTRREAIASLEELLPATIARELTASPYALRAGLLGLERGCTMSFHERRVRLPIARAHRPDVAFWQHGESLTVWQEGVLQEPKYYSFFIDGPVFAYNPNYRGKWRSHELLHGAVGFFWSPHMTRFEAYLAARLAELLPVVHWYGLDEILRPRCAEHAHLEDPPLLECSRCEEVASGLFEKGNGEVDAALLARAQRHYEAALHHFELEWEACTRELHHRTVTPALYKNLNASSDALGYVRAHWPRMTRGESFGRWIEAFMCEGRDHVADLERYMARVLDVGARLFGGTITLDVRSAREAQHRAALQDLGYRALYLLDLETRAPRRRDLLASIAQGVEMLSEQVLADTLDMARVKEGLGALVSGLEEVRGRLRDPLLVDDVLATGHDLLDLPAGKARELAQVIEGIELASPTLTYALAGAEIEPEAFYEGLLESDAFAERGPLLGRLAAFLEARGDTDFAEVARLEEMILAWPRHDEIAATLGVGSDSAEAIEEALARGDRQLRLHASVRHGTFRAGILEAVLEEDFGEDPERVCQIVRRIDAEHGLVIGECDAQSWQIIEALAAAASSTRDRVVEGVSDWNQSSLRQLISEGVCVLLDV